MPIAKYVVVFGQRSRNYVYVKYDVGWKLTPPDYTFLKQQLELEHSLFPFQAGQKLSARLFRKRWFRRNPGHPIVVIHFQIDEDHPDDDIPINDARRIIIKD